MKKPEKVTTDILINTHILLYIYQGTEKHQSCTDMSADDPQFLMSSGTLIHTLFLFLLFNKCIINRYKVNAIT